MITKSFTIENDIGILKNNQVLFYGENLGLKNLFKKKIKYNKEKIKTLIFFQEEIIKNPDIIFNEVFNSSLFEEKKLILIYDTSDKILPIVQEIESKIKNQKIYLFSDILDKKSKLRNYFEKSKESTAVPCYADNEITIKKIILSELKNFKNISSQNVNTIMQSCGLNRDKLYNELDKIKICFDNKIINNDKLFKLLNISENSDFSLLKDEALIGNKIRTNKLLIDTVIEPEKNIFYLAMFNQRLSMLAQIANRGKEEKLEEIISNIKPPIFWKDKPLFIEQAKKWSKHKIEKAQSDLFDLELKIKSNSMINHEILLKKFIIDICNLANA